MLIKFEYSEKERDLFTCVGLGDIMDHINPITLYRMAAEHEFIRNTDDEISDSVRRCLIAINGLAIFRMTPEWDALIFVCDYRRYSGKIR